VACAKPRSSRNSSMGAHYCLAGLITVKAECASRYRGFCRLSELYASCWLRARYVEASLRLCLRGAEGRHADHRAFRRCWRFIVCIDTSTVPKSKADKYFSAAGMQTRHIRHSTHLLWTQSRLLLLRLTRHTLTEGKHRVKQSPH
jgi:hypothetical protein